MEIVEAIDELKKTIGIACNSTGPAGTPKQKEEFTSLGNDISASLTSFQPEVRPQDRSIHTFVPGAALPEGEEAPPPVTGGRVRITFVGGQQPEAARTLDSILTPIINEALGTDTGQHRSRLGKTTDRIMDFRIPTQVAGNFVDHVIEVTNRIKATPELRKQFQAGIELSIEHINKIDGPKPYIELNLGKGYELKDGVPDLKPPHFTLKISGTPLPLARTLAEAVGNDVEDFPNTIQTTNRDHTKTYEGGKEFKIALDSPKVPKAFEAIKQYVRIMNEYRANPGQGQGSGGPGM